MILMLFRFILHGAVNFKHMGSNSFMSFAPQFERRKLRNEFEMVHYGHNT